MLLTFLLHRPALAQDQGNGRVAVAAARRDRHLLGLLGARGGQPVGRVRPVAVRQRLRPDRRHLGQGRQRARHRRPVDALQPCAARVRRPAGPGVGAGERRPADRRRSGAAVRRVREHCARAGLAHHPHRGGDPDRAGRPRGEDEAAAGGQAVCAGREHTAERGHRREAVRAAPQEADENGTGRGGGRTAGDGRFESI